MIHLLPRRSRTALVVCMAVLAGCTDDPALPPGPQGDAVGVIVSSMDRTLTVFDVENPTGTFSIGLAPDGSPVTIAARGATVVVPMGALPAVVVVDLSTRAIAHTVPLPEGSGATGVAFLNDSIAIVANPGLNTVSPVNVRRGTRGAEIAVGAYPQAAIAINDTVYVLNANVVDFAPAGPATLSVITGTPPQVVRTITLSGTNAGSATATSDGRLIVVNSGSFGLGDGSISIVSRATLTETAHVTGFGDFPGAVGMGPDGRVHVASFTYGVAIWDVATSGFIYAPGQAIAPGGVPSTSGLAFDEQGRLYTLVPDCREPSRALRLSTTYDVDVEVPTGICPFGIVFTRIP
jgi:hypothetical protein